MTSHIQNFSPARKATGNAPDFPVANRSDLFQLAARTAAPIHIVIWTPTVSEKNFAEARREAAQPGPVMVMPVSPREARGKPPIAREALRREILVRSLVRAVRPGGIPQSAGSPV